MGINELVADLENSSKLKSAARETWKKAEGEYEIIKERIRSLISDDFAKYLDGRTEIPREDFIVRVYEEKNTGSGTPVARQKAQIILGKEQDSDKARKVTLRFLDFVGRYKPLEVDVLRFFPPVEHMVVKQGSFYGRPNSYMKVDVGKN